MEPGLSALVPSVTEIVFALGAGGSLVGNTNQCDFPDSAKSRVQGRRLHESGPGADPRAQAHAGRAHPADAQAAACTAGGDEAPDLRVAACRPCRRVRRDRVGRRAAGPVAASSGTGRPDAAAARFPARVQRHAARVRRDIEHAPDDRGRRYVHQRPGSTGRGQERVRVDPDGVPGCRPGGGASAPTRRSSCCCTRTSKRRTWRSAWAGAGSPRCGTGRVYDGIDEDLLFRPGPRVVDGIVLLARLLHSAQLDDTRQSPAGVGRAGPAAGLGRGALVRGRAGRVWARVRATS